jgi:RHS repeat-associated protein
LHSLYKVVSLKSLIDKHYNQKMINTGNIKNGANAMPFYNYLTSKKSTKKVRSSNELKDHLSNVRLTISDAKIIVDNGTNGIVDAADQFVPEVRSYKDYYPFGFDMPGRQYSSGAKYRYTYNGKETDQETGTQDYGFRILDNRIAKFLSIDPLTKDYPELTPYQFASNTPIWGVDWDGLEVRVYTETEGAGHTFISVGKDDDLVVYTYGRYAGTNTESHGINILSNGPGVLVKLSGSTAKQYIRSKQNIDGAKAFEITDVKDADVAKFFEDQLNSSTQSPTKGEYAGKENAKVIDEYKLFSNNCTTKACEAINQAGSKALDEPEYPNAATGTPKKETYVIPASLESHLSTESKQPSSKPVVKDVTENSKKEIDSKTVGGSGGGY